MRELTKDVEVGGQRYQVVKMPADKASWINNMLQSVLIKHLQSAKKTGETDAETDKALAELSPQERADGLVSFLWLNAAAELSEEAYSRIQTRALMACRVYEVNGSVSLVMMPDGRWATKRVDGDISQDAKTVDQLIVEAIRFNLSPFFLGNESSEAPLAPVQP